MPVAELRSDRQPDDAFVGVEAGVLLQPDSEVRIQRAAAGEFLQSSHELAGGPSLREAMWSDDDDAMTGPS